MTIVLVMWQVDFLVATEMGVWLSAALFVFQVVS